jgi:hypothetical protein
MDLYQELSEGCFQFQISNCTPSLDGGMRNNIEKVILVPL